VLARSRQEVVMSHCIDLVQPRTTDRPSASDQASSCLAAYRLPRHWEMFVQTSLGRPRTAFSERLTRNTPTMLGGPFADGLPEYCFQLV
jgi:hypothetical protein